MVIDRGADRDNSLALFSPLSLFFAVDCKLLLHQCTFTFEILYHKVQNKFDALELCVVATPRGVQNS
jgi:hypothetical protein